jgi:hypothetical protein
MTPCGWRAGTRVLFRMDGAEGGGGGLSIRQVAVSQAAPQGPTGKKSRPAPTKYVTV